MPPIRPASRLERALPWSGAVAALCWVGQNALTSTDATDAPGRAATATINGHLALNHAGVACLVLMGVALLFFATSVRTLLRSSEAGEATCSSIAYAGWVVAVAGLSQMVVWSWGLINGAAAAGDDAALHTLSFVGYFAWAGMGIGLAVAFVATGLGGLRGAVLPRWFAVASIVIGVLGALGDAGIPPGGLVTYLLLPVWLVAASIFVARGLARAALPASQVLATA